MASHGRDASPAPVRGYGGANPCVHSCRLASALSGFLYSANLLRSVRTLMPKILAAWVRLRRISDRAFQSAPAPSRDGHDRPSKAGQSGDGSPEIRGDPLPEQVATPTSSRRTADPPGDHVFQFPHGCPAVSVRRRTRQSGASRLTSRRWPGKFLQEKSARIGRWTDAAAGAVWSKE